MAKKKTATPKKITNEDYYYLSRCRNWSVATLMSLFFNERLPRLPRKNSPQEKFIYLIKQGMESGALPHLSQERIRTRWDGSARSILVDGFVVVANNRDEIELYGTQLLSEQAWVWSMGWSRSLLWKEKGLEPSPEFEAMGEELLPCDEWRNMVTYLKAWTLGDLIRIVFGEKYKNWPASPENSTITSFVRLIEADIEIGDTKPLSLVPTTHIKDLKFSSISLVNFVESSRLRAWFRDSQLDIMPWVERLFDLLLDSERAALARKNRGKTEGPCNELEKKDKEQPEPISGQKARSSTKPDDKESLSALPDDDKSQNKNPRHSESKMHKEEVRVIATNFWANDTNLTIQDVILSDKVNSITKSDGTNYAEQTIRDWIKDLAPDNSPGRRPKKN